MQRCEEHRVQQFNTIETELLLHPLSSNSYKKKKRENIKTTTEEKKSRILCKIERQQKNTSAAKCSME